MAMMLCQYAKCSPNLVRVLHNLRIRCGFLTCSLLSCKILSVCLFVSVGCSPRNPVRYAVSYPCWSLKLSCLVDLLVDLLLHSVLAMNGMCYQFQQGTCRYGSACRFAHFTPRSRSSYSTPEKYDNAGHELRQWSCAAVRTLS